MKNNFILAESEKKRILGLHNKYINKPQTWVIKEEFTGTAGDGYDGDVAACKKDLPYNVAVKTGQIKSSSEWRTLRQAWGSDGSMSQNLKMRDEMCDGWRSGDSKESGSNADDNTYYTVEDRTRDEDKAWEKWGCITSKTKKVVGQKGGVKYHHEDGIFDLMGDYNDNNEYETDSVRWSPYDDTENNYDVKIIYSCDDPIVTGLSGGKTNTDQSSTDNGSEVKTNTESDSNVENVINTKKTEISELIEAIQNDAMYGYSEDEDKKEIEDSKAFIETINATNVCSEENIEYYKKKSGSLLIKKEKQKTKTFAPEISIKMGEIAGKLEEIIVFCKSQVNESFRKDFYRFL
jgi:hypothetical protein